jgi:hypothetical protein
MSQNFVIIVFTTYSHGGPQTSSTIHRGNDELWLQYDKGGGGASTDIDGCTSMTVKSPCEAEYTVSAAAAVLATWMRHLLEEITRICVPRPIIIMDNTTAIALAKNPILHDLSKAPLHQGGCRARRCRSRAHRHQRGVSRQTDECVGNQAFSCALGEDRSHRWPNIFSIKRKIPPVSFIQNRVHNLAFITGFTPRRWLNPQSSLILRIKTFTTCLLLITLEAFPLQLRFSGLAYYILYSQINIYGL